MCHSIVLLGSTGSIGVNTLIVASRYGITIEGLVAGKNIELLNAQIAQHHPKFVAIADHEDRDKVNHPHVYCGAEGILRMLELTTSPMIVNAMVGYAGLMPTLKSIELGRKVALANKESLVVAGEFIDTNAIVPIDSEHFGLWYLMDSKPVEKLYITASGGAFRDWAIEDMRGASFTDALRHPNWSMGSKITIDSATMTNKLFELLEAKWLFGTSSIDALIERRSLVHALVQFVDGSTTAHFAGIDMKLPIAYALMGKVEEAILPSLNLLELGSIAFEPIEPSRYPIWQIKDHILQNPHLGVVVNAANEVAIERFAQGKIRFFEMSQQILGAYKEFERVHPTSIAEVVQIDLEVRRYLQKP